MDIETGDKRTGETRMPTTARTFAHTPVRALQLLDPSLCGIWLENTPRLVIGRQATDVDWQIWTCQNISRKHCILYVRDDIAWIARHRSASQPVLVNGVEISEQRHRLYPWTFIELGSKTIVVLGDLKERPTQLILPARNDVERAIRAYAVGRNVARAAKLAGWSRRKLEERLRRTKIGRALLNARLAS